MQKFTIIENDFSVYGGEIGEYPIIMIVIMMFSFRYKRSDTEAEETCHCEKVYY